MIKITTSSNRTIWLNPTYIVAVVKCNHTDYATIVEVDYVSECAKYEIKEDAKTIIDEINKQEKI